MSREGKLVKNTAILALGTFFPKVATFVTLPILTAYMTKAEYGTYDLVLTMVSLLLPAITLQIQSAAFRFLLDVRNDDEGKTKVISTIFCFVVPLSLVVIAVLFFFLGKLSMPVRLAICALFLVDIISCTLKQVIRGLTDNLAYAIGCILSALGQVVFILILVLWMRTALLGGVISACIAELIAVLVIFLRGRIYRYIRVSAFSKEKLKEMIGYSWPIVPNALCQQVMHASDRIVLTAIMGVATSGVYSVAYKFPSILAFAQTTFNMAWQENATMYAGDDDVESYYSSMFEGLFHVCAGGMAFLVGITPILFRVFVAAGYDEAYNQIPILYMAILFYCMSSFWGGIFVAHKKTKEVATTTAVAAATNVVIDVTTMPFIGMYAASVSTLVSYIVLCFLRLRSVKKIMDLDYNWKHVALILALLVVESFLCFRRSLPLDIVNFVFGVFLLFFLNRKMVRSYTGKILRKLHISGRR